MAFTEFYCQSGGDNLNAGSTTGNTAAQTYAGGTFVRATGVFTVASGDPSADGVTVGDFASVYTTAGATVATFVGRVTARSTTTITVSTTAISGATSTVSETAAAATCKVGGAWKGPNAAVSFPFGFAASTMTDSSGNIPRVNLKNDANYNTTATVTHNLGGPIAFSGYSTSPGDTGRATIDSGTTASTTMSFTSTTGYYIVTNLILKNSATTGSGSGFTNGGYYSYFSRITVAGCRAYGIQTDGYYGKWIECEVYDACKASGYGFNILGNVGHTLVRCIVHGNTVNSAFRTQSGDVVFVNCIAYDNAAEGFYLAGAQQHLLIGCDSYLNGGDGFEIENTCKAVVMENCNAVGNAGYGIQGPGGNTSFGHVRNCGFSDNTSGETAAMSHIAVDGSVSYGAGVDPWVDPANGDFRINLAAAKGAGRGSFMQSESGHSGTTGYPDIGAAQHVDAGGGGLLTHPGMVGGIRG